MPATRYEFRIEPRASLAEVERTLHLALYGVEGLFGRARVRLEVQYVRDDARRRLTIDVTSDVGEAVVRMLTSLLAYEFGDSAFEVNQIHPRRARREAVA